MTSPQSHRPPPSALSRWLEPFSAGLWILFLVWTAIVAILWLGSLGEAELQRTIANPDLRGALVWLFDAADGIWLVLAAANIHLSLAASEGLPTIRRRALATLIVGWAVAAMSALRSFPLGPIHYTGRLGVHLGPVPLGFPLLWLVAVLGARAAAMHLAARASHARVAVITGMLAMLTDANLEQIAWKVRVWWLWYPARTSVPLRPPALTYLTWLIVPAALTLLFREPVVARAVAAPPKRPVIVFAVVNGLFFLAHFSWR